MQKLQGKLVVTPDNSTPGSEGRLYLALPEEMSYAIGRPFNVIGHFKRDAAAMFIESGTGSRVTPRRQIWWKNGVRDHGIRRNWNVTLYILEPELFVVRLVSETDDQPVALPMHQETFF